MAISQILSWLWWLALGFAVINWGYFVRTLRLRHSRCRTSADMETLQCTHLAHRPEVRWWGWPSWVWGGVYLGILVGTVCVPFPWRWWFRSLLTTVGIAVSVYLLALLHRLRAHCTHCYIAHGLNLFLWLTALLHMGFVLITG